MLSWQDCSHIIKIYDSQEFLSFLQLQDYTGRNSISGDSYIILHILQKEMIRPSTLIQGPISRKASPVSAESFDDSTVLMKL